MSGEMSMAPMITAAEPTSRPMLASRQEHTSSQARSPRTGMPSSMRCSVPGDVRAGHEREPLAHAHVGAQHARRTSCASSRGALPAVSRGLGPRLEVGPAGVPQRQHGRGLELVLEVQVAEGLGVVLLDEPRGVIGDWSGAAGTRAPRARGCWPACAAPRPRWTRSWQAALVARRRTPRARGRTCPRWRGAAVSSARPTLRAISLESRSRCRAHSSAVRESASAQAVGCAFSATSSSSCRSEEAADAEREERVPGMIERAVRT